MVAPLIPYAIRGALWYQGESNGPTAKQYRDIMETMIADWRKAWNQGNFPFIYVQIANHQDLIKEPVKDDPMVYVREGQLQNLSIPNTAMVSAIDNADPNDPGNIHPKNKQDAALRLANIALNRYYKKSVADDSGPLYKAIKIDKNKAIISFDHSDGLHAAGDKLTYFEIAGEDKIFYPADAKIKDGQVIVQSKKVKTPVAVRFAWKNTATPNLFNGVNLPASCFTTEN
jgi:sialate O-acetylesterase